MVPVPVVLWPQNGVHAILQGHPMLAPSPCARISLQDVLERHTSMWPARGARPQACKRLWSSRLSGCARMAPLVATGQACTHTGHLPPCSAGGAAPLDEPRICPQASGAAWKASRKWWTGLLQVLAGRHDDQQLLPQLLQFHPHPSTSVASYLRYRGTLRVRPAGALQARAGSAAQPHMTLPHCLGKSSAPTTRRHHREPQLLRSLSR